MGIETDAGAGCQQDCTSRELTWEPQIDCEIMKLFYADPCWELASVDMSDESEVLTKLQSLDALITAFDARIGHSDDGFYAWRRLHQIEMDCARVERIGTFLKTVHYKSQYREIWHDEKWETRYGWMVRKRKEFAKVRLDYLKQFGFAVNVGAFWGVKTTTSNRLRKPSNKKKERKTPAISDYWSTPIDELLRIAAGGADAVYEQMREAFWGPRFGMQPRMPGSKVLQMLFKVEEDKENLSVGEIQHLLEDETKIKLEEDELLPW